MIVDKNALKELQCALMPFADNADAMIDGLEAQQRMQEILDTCDRLHSATGGHVKEKKTTFYAQKWAWKQSQKQI